MQNLPAFPVALEQTFQSSWHFHFQAVTKVFLLLWKTNHILAFTVVTKINYMMQVWPIFWSYLERLIQRYSSLKHRYTARDQIRGLRIIWTFCQTIYRTDILVYQLPFPFLCTFAIDIFKHVILRFIFLRITYSYSLHCILHHMFY